MNDKYKYAIFRIHNSHLNQVKMNILFYLLIFKGASMMVPFFSSTAVAVDTKSVLLKCSSHT